jgi:hypothetical protein
LVPYANFPNEGTESQIGAEGVWRPSPRWSTIKGEGCIVVEQEAAKARVENCSKYEADDLTLAKPEELSGY